ncbi:probable E3 ubiquitin-protein ligase RHG1A [Brassica napus]|uniref:probable E3 ubiquitin-protein ligase RHG1A n=1 Tax=Brassica napus TaxID=3708 RepID=UPI0006AB252E|nr:probable E3 ubiquitin-protein ligase RHG1A [Brassica napus]
MDGCSGKRSVNRMVLPRKASGTVLLRENMSKKDEKSVSFCSRIGCSAKVSYTKGTRMVNNTKLGSSSNGKEIVRSSSRTPGGFGYLRKPATFTTGSPLIGSSVSSSGSEHTVKGGGLSRNGLRCSSVSEVLPTNATRISVTKRKNSDGESSSSSTRASKTSVSGTKGRNQSSSSRITDSDNRRNRIVPSIRGNSVVSVNGKRSSSSHSRPSSNSGPSPSRSLVSQDSLSRYNINIIAEVLLALERIEHDQELTYERLASLETSLFSSGVFRFYDEHRDMRLDIDNMSYEELLALGDKMGTVSTALSEEALSKSLLKSIYQETDETGSTSLNKDDDIKCSICQEEYVDGDEVGTMSCEHMYHVSCVQQWLRMKSWCPICKTSAEEEK